MSRTPALLAALLLGCHGTHGVDLDPDAAVAAEPQALAAGFLSHRRGIVRPYCHGVLVGPRAALAARGCVASTYPEALSFAVGSDPGYEIPVVGVAPGSDPDSDIVELVLDAPLEHGRPASMGDAMPAVGSSVHATSFVHVGAGDGAPTESRWTADVIEAQGGRFVAELSDGVSGCHGDLGVAAFQDGHLVGVLTGVADGGPPHPVSEVCVTRFVFSPVR